MRGQETLTFHSGFAVQRLLSLGGCSNEKLPMIIATVLQMFFGNLDKAIFNKLVKSSPTYGTASDRVMHVFTLDAARVWGSADVSPEEAVLQAALCMDASNKSSKDMVIKLISYTNGVDEVRLKALKTDIVHSKKSLLGADHTYKSIQSEISDLGLVKIRGGTADGFGLAELREVLRRIDALQAQTPTPQIELGCPGLFVQYGRGNFASLRLWNCSMHGDERVLRPMLTALLQTGGLENNATVTQNLYRISRYTHMFADELQAILLLTVGDDPTKLRTLPRSLTSLFKQACATRWLSLPRQCSALIRLMDAAADDEIIDIVRQELGGEASEQWLRVKDLCTCFHDDAVLSHISLVFIYLANRAPGGKKGEGYVNLPEIVGFMASPYQRVAIKIAAKLYSIQIAWSKFTDSNTAVHSNTRCISTRLPESVTEDRNKLALLCAIEHSWETAMPEESAYVEKESTRALNLGLLETASELKEHCTKMVETGNELTLHVFYKCTAHLRNIICYVQAYKKRWVLQINTMFSRF